MERKLPLKEMGIKISKIRKSENLNQINFYKSLFPDKSDLEDENIKKKMNAIERGKRKSIDYDLLIRLHDRYDISIDYLLGFETAYPNYENKQVCEYTGLSPKAVCQLHFWNKYKDKDLPDFSSDVFRNQYRNFYMESSRIKESKWVLNIINNLLERKGIDEKTEISDLSILYDIYMMAIGGPEVIQAYQTDIGNSENSSENRLSQFIDIWAAPLLYKDSMGEVHNLDMNMINKQIWKERLLRDLDEFIEELNEKKFGY